MPYQQPKPEIAGWMSERELNWLYEQARLRRQVVEVGSWFGRSTHALCCGAAGVVYAVDTFKGSPSEIEGAHTFAQKGDVYAEFMKHCGHFQNLRVMQYPSIEAAKEFEDRSLDMVFIDAEHTYEAVSADVAAWLPKIRGGGLLCGHDRTQDGVPRMRKECFAEQDANPVDSIWAWEVKPTA